MTRDPITDLAIESSQPENDGVDDVAISQGT
jgi:hypothetical protein